MKTNNTRTENANRIMENVSVLGTLQREGFSEVVVDRVERSLASHETLLRELKSALFYIHSYGGDVTNNFECGGNIEQINKAIRQAEGK